MSARLKTVLLLVLATATWTVQAVAAAPERLAFQDDDRILVLAPHPDDEAIACAGVIQQATARGLPVRVVFLTNGDANFWSFGVLAKRPVLFPGAVRRMGELRHDEALAAGKQLGLRGEQLTFLGYPDFGTYAIWRTRWRNEAPLRGLFTAARSVPYKSSLRSGAAYKGEEILQDLTTSIREFKPTKIFVSHPADVNVDHRALYLFSRVAAWEAGNRASFHPYLVHFRNWPSPRGLHLEATVRPPNAFDGDDVAWQTCPLTPAQITTKRAAIRAHRSQYAYSAGYLNSSLRPNELFGDYPTIRLAPGKGGGTLVRAAARNPEAASETRTIERDGDCLRLTIAFTQPHGRAVNAVVNLFGYRPDKPFAAMPKFQARLVGRRYTLWDQRTRLPEKLCEVSHDAEQIVLRVPLAVLGEPDRLLMSVQTSFTDVPADAGAWRVIELAPEQFVAGKPTPRG